MDDVSQDLGGRIYPSSIPIEQGDNVVSDDGEGSDNDVFEEDVMENDVVFEEDVVENDDDIVHRNNMNVK